MEYCLHSLLDGCLDAPNHLLISACDQIGHLALIPAPIETSSSGSRGLGLVGSRRKGSQLMTILVNDVLVVVGRACCSFVDS
jgi:hypothetical protein